MKYIHETFDSIDQMLEVINSRKVNPVFQGERLASQKESSWSGTRTYKEAEELARDGWDEPVKDIKAEQRALVVKSNVTTQKARPRNSVVGYAPCVPAAIMGLPESMIATERVPSKVKAVTIVYANCAHSGTKTTQFVKAGAAILKMVNDLELKGYRVRLVCEMYSAIDDYNKETISTRVTVKDWRQPLDLKKIAFPIANAAMLRRIGFKWIETTPAIESRAWPDGYGKPLANNKNSQQISELYKKNGLLNDNEYYINMQLVEEKRYDTDEIIKAAGMTLK